jgi:transglutaminase-like putative cysteine protease
MSAATSSPATSRTNTGRSPLLTLSVAGAVSVVCASTALSGVIGGASWFAYVLVTVLVMIATGIGLRALRTPTVLIPIGQALVLTCLAVILFTQTALLGVLPGPSALHDLGGVLSQSISEVQTGVPPVQADAPILCLVVLSMGLVALVVDALVTTAGVPAAAGLVLLCVYAVPASLDDDLLPWYSFVLGAAGFTLLLAVDGVARHQAWRGKLGLPASASTGIAPAAIGVTAVAAVLALVVGSTFTVIGTVGRLPGADGGSGGTGYLGIKPFTTLRGLLNEKGTTELFDVYGLPGSPPYLDAVTLSNFVPNVGWQPESPMPAGVGANQARLPMAPGEAADNPTTSIRIDPVNWEDFWLPTFGVPARLQNVADNYHYDAESGVIYSQKAQHPASYTESAMLEQPSADQLRGAGTDYSEIDAKYLKIDGVNNRVSALAQQLTSAYDNEFDKAQAIYDYFHDPANGFTYSTSTAQATTSDALVDFLFNGKTGYCEQYASAMGVMLRAIGIPTRVEIGFTDGYVSGDHRVITAQDAHAWDEVFFPDYGWITFDPTPLSDGRAQVPAYLNTNSTGNGPNPGNDKPAHQNPQNQTRPNQPKANQPTVQIGAPDATPSGSGFPIWQLTLLGALLLLGAIAAVLARRTRDTGSPGRHRLLTGIAIGAWSLAVLVAAAFVSWWLVALVVVLGIAAAPAAIRELRRRRRLRTIARLGANAAGAAWSELLAESWDRGTAVPGSDTVRLAATRLVKAHDLDREGAESLHTLVGVVERDWYGSNPANAGDPVIVTAFDGVRRSLRRNSPLAFTARLLPRSVLKPRK